MTAIPRGYFPRPPIEYMVKEEVFEADLAKDRKNVLQSIARCILDHHLSLQQIETELREKKCHTYLYVTKGAVHQWELGFEFGETAEKGQSAVDQKIKMPRDENFKLLDQVQAQVVEELCKEKERHASTRSNPPLNWAYEVSKLNRTSISQFDSSIDTLLLSHLGQELFENHVAKVYIQGVRFVFIADRHLEQKFRTLFQSLIQEANHPTSPVALFIEGWERDPKSEEILAKGHLKSNSLVGKFYGIEERSVSIIHTWMVKGWELRNGSLDENYRFDFIYDLFCRQGYYEIWNQVRVRASNDSLRKIVFDIDQALKAKTVGEALKVLEKTES